MSPLQNANLYPSAVFGGCYRWFWASEWVAAAQTCCHVGVWMSAHQTQKAQTVWCVQKKRRLAAKGAQEGKNWANEEVKSGHTKVEGRRGCPLIPSWPPVNWVLMCHLWSYGSAMNHAKYETLPPCSACKLTDWQNLKQWILKYREYGFPRSFNLAPVIILWFY